MIRYPLISAFSLFTSLLIFTLFTCICCVLSKRAGWTALRIAIVGTALLIVRCLLPLELPWVRVIHISSFFSAVCEWVESPILGSFKVWMLILLSWVLGSAVSLIRLATALYRQKKLIYSVWISPDSYIYSIYTQIAKELSCTKLGNVGVSPNFSTAMMAGFFSPHVLLPESLEDLPDDELSLIFRHEITHFLYHDQWIRLFMEFFCCLLWWNPAVYYLRSSVGNLLEMRCDRQVCEYLSPQQEYQYAETLLRSIKRTSPRRTYLTAIGYTEHSAGRAFSHRFKQIVQRSNKRTSKWLSTIFISMTVVLFLGSYTFVIQPASPGPNYGGAKLEDTGNVFILQYSDGSLELYMDNRLYGYISLDSLNEDSFSSIPVYQVKISKEGAPK